MRTIPSAAGLGLVFASLACASYGGPGPGASAGDAAPQNEGGSGDEAGTALPECTAQRAVHLMAGSGGLAWFTLVWPVPTMIESFEARFAYDNVFFASGDSNLPPDHPLFTRRVAQRTLWQNLGKRPSATVMVAGTNQTHTTVPTQRTFANGNDTFSLAGALQSSLRAKLPTLSLGRSGLVTRGPVPGVVADSVEFAIALLKTNAGISAAQEAELRPSTAAIDEWTQKSTYTPFRNLAEYLFFTAAAFRLGLVATVVAPALEDDPHSAFADKALLTKRADELTHTLDSFYDALSKAVEPSCTRRRLPVSLADNVVLVVTGDTPKNSFIQQGWPDSTPQNSNWIFARTNGFLRPGWFGEIKETTAQGFDGHTGGLAATSNKDAALAGILYAIARGDAAAVSAVGVTVDYAGLVDPVAP
jgi:hypothetical protein